MIAILPHGSQVFDCIGGATRYDPRAIEAALMGSAGLQLNTQLCIGELVMLRRLVVGLVGAVVLTGSLLTVAAAQDAKKDTAKDKKADTKDAKKDGKEIKGKITKVDVDKMTFSVETEDGKKMDFTVDKSVQFIGPRGGLSKMGIKDDRVKVGAQVKLVMDATGKNLKEVHLPTRGGAGKDKAKKDTAKDK
jgi:hypothetical protein